MSYEKDPIQASEAGTGPKDKVNFNKNISQNQLDIYKTVLSGMFDDTLKRERVLNADLTPDAFPDSKDRNLFIFLKNNKDLDGPSLVKKINEDFNWYKTSEEIQKCGGFAHIEHVRMDYRAHAEFMFDEALMRVIEACNSKKVFTLASQITDNFQKGNFAKVEQLKKELSRISITHVDIPEEMPGVNKPGPLAPEAYHGIAGEIIQMIEPHTEADPAALLISFLTAFGNIIGADAHFVVEADKHPARLFCVLVGNTSKGRKGTSQGWIRKIFNPIDPEWWKDKVVHGLATGEGLANHVKDPEYKDPESKSEIINPGVSDKRLLAIESELAQALKVMSREGNTLSPYLRQAWDTGNLRTLTKSNPIKATGAHISVIAHVTREELNKSLRETEAFNGFANRFLWLYVERSKELAFGGDLDESELNVLIERLQDVTAWARTEPERVNWHESTKEIWERIYSELSRERYGIHGVILSRAEAQTTRLALIYALLDRSTEIYPEHLQAALSVWEYVEQSVTYVFQDHTGNRNADKILQALKKNKELSRDEIYRDVFQKNLLSEDIDTALNILESQNIVQLEKNKTGKREKTIIKLL